MAEAILFLSFLWSFVRCETSYVLDPRVLLGVINISVAPSPCVLVSPYITSCSIPAANYEHLTEHLSRLISHEISQFFCRVFILIAPKDCHSSKPKPRSLRAGFENRACNLIRGALFSPITQCVFLETACFCFCQHPIPLHCWYWQLSL